MVLEKGKPVIHQSKRLLPVCRLGAENILPRFCCQLEDCPVFYGDNLPPEALKDRIPSVALAPLPYRLQDKWNASLEVGSLDTVCVENDFLKATFYPSLGGRMASLLDRAGDRELLFNNPVFRPANLGIRGAWFSGGVEWNAPVFGHTLLNCSPVFMGQVRTDRGPILRIYEFDRKLQVAWQVDVWLPDKAKVLWVHVKLRNLNPHPVPVYWWSNIAVPLQDRTRVLSHLSRSVSHKLDNRVINCDFPYRGERDISYPSQLEYADSIFFMDRRGGRPWIACVDGEGRGLLQCSTRKLVGRKLWGYGSSPGARNWMDLLSVPGKGHYIEIQAGITATQTQTLPLETMGTIEWTECYSPLRLEPGGAHQKDFAKASDTVAGWMMREIPDRLLEDAERFLSGHADASIDLLMTRGSPWGAFHEALTGQRTPGLLFDTEVTDAERPWQELINDGCFSKATLQQEPQSWCISEEWTRALSVSMKRFGETWLHHLHLGVAALESGNVDMAEEHFEISACLRENMHSRRNLAIVNCLRGEWSEADRNYRRAWNISGQSIDLAVEMAGVYSRHGVPGQLDEFVSGLAESLQSHERIQLAIAEAALQIGETQRVRDILDRDFRMIAEGENILADLWYGSFTAEERQRLGRELNDDEEDAVRQAHPLPVRIDLQEDVYRSPRQRRQLISTMTKGVC